ncbi:MAG TPA: hypothetical protein VK427_14115 [Kofleriaceae bacterium]|nr:hypothetical protein [Kofleriaceae bacterium]
MQLTPLFAAALALGSASLTACATDSDSDADLGGPDALTGFMWKTKVSQNGFDFLFGFQFSDAAVTASNTCTASGATLTASVASPVKYRYSATVPSGGQGGNDACSVEVAKGSFNFELAPNNKLLVTTNGQTVEFAAASSARSGLYGDWTATVNGLTITWSMGGGKIKARAACPGNKSASVTVDADFKNFVDILEASEKTVGDSSFNCSVSISKAMAEYRFDDDALLLTVDGKTLEFKRD